MKNKTIWLLERIGDDYHCGGIEGAYDTEKAAEAQKSIEVGKGNPCHPEHPQCDFVYHYSITEYKVQSSTNER